MTLYVIRHIATGKLMPQLTGRARGYSHWNPGRPPTLRKKETGIPRFLVSEAQAKRVIAQWCANPNAREKYYEDGPDFITTDDGRTKSDLEVVPVEVQGI